jgi:Adenylate and Guanylate cyclase catalytic domain
MESTGREHCIHASQETADILAALGKGFWVHPREDKIHAKGKGELQTYWINPKGGRPLLDFSTNEVSTNEESEWNAIDDMEIVEELVDEGLSNAHERLRVADR